MRISSLQIFNIANKSMADVNQAVVKTQEQMSTGKRVLSPADDPVAATKILALSDELAAVEQYRKNIDIAQNNLALEESVLGGVTNVVQRMQELAIAAGNTASLTQSEYRAMASEVGERLDELVNLLNTRSPGGDYIFGGYKSRQPPFEGNATNGFRYLGDDGQQRIRVSNNTTVAATDSGKELFLDVDSSNKTIQTYASPGNQSNPPAAINIGEVIDQEAYDEFYPSDMVITFNSDSNVTPAAKNYTVTDRASGRVIVADAAFTGGESIEVNGVRVRIDGSPLSGAAAIPATRSFGVDALPVFPADFTAPNNATFTITVGRHTETMILDANITNVNDLAIALNDGANGNANKLTRLDVTASSQGFEMPQGINFTVAGGNTTITSMMGFDTNSGIESSDGMRAEPGDRFFIESTEKQDILTTLARFKGAMEAYDDSDGADGKAIIGEVVASTLDNLSSAQTSVLDVVSRIGARVNTLESTRDLHLDTELVTNEVLASLRDVDYAEAATRLSAQTLVLQAAQQSFIRVSQLNLFARL